MKYPEAKSPKALASCCGKRQLSEEGLIAEIEKRFFIGGKMKKFLFIFLSLVFVSRLYAQEFKFIGGISYSRYTIRPEVYVSPFFPPSEYNYEKNNARGYLLGVGIEFSLSKILAIEVDSLYFQKGCSIYYREIPDMRWYYTLNTFSIPILLKIKLPSKPLAYILGGGEFSYILSHKEQGRDITENTKIFDYGLILGGGLEIKMSNNKLFIEGRYHIGLGNITKENLRFESIKTNALLLIVALKFS